jgi:predicted transcriptional regulator
MKKTNPLGPILFHTKQRVIDHIATGMSAREHRLRAKKSLREVADAMEISPPYLSDLELGRRNWSETLAAQFLEAIQ